MLLNSPTSPTALTAQYLRQKPSTLARQSVALLTRKTADFIPSTLWLLKSAGLHVCSVMQKVDKK